MGDVPLIDADRFLQCGRLANSPEAALRKRRLLAEGAFADVGFWNGYVTVFSPLRSRPASAGGATRDAAAAIMALKR
jgi:hypothetical protein